MTKNFLSIKTNGTDHYYLTTLILRGVYPIRQGLQVPV